MLKQKRGKLGRKAQITIFIIIGILILATTASYIYVKTRIMEEEITVPEVLIPKVPAEVQPVKEYIESCIKRTAENGLKLLEDHGGYTDFSEFSPNPIFPTQGNAVEYIKGSNILIPYWHYMKSDNECKNNCKPGSMMLRLTKSAGSDSVEMQMEDYIKLNLKECLNNFDAFKNQGYRFVEKGDIKPEVNIRGEDIIIKVNYALDVEIQGKRSSIKSYATRIESKISELYEIAEDLVNYEIDKCFIEKHVLDYLSYYEGIENDDIPPMTSISDDKRKIWIKQDVEKQIKTKTFTALKMIQIMGTSGMDWPTAQFTGNLDNVKQGIYDNFVFFPLKEDHIADIEISYNWHQPYLEIVPSTGLLIMPTRVDFNIGGGTIGKIAKTLFPGLSSYKYLFSYQYSFPVIIDITVPTDTGIERLRFAIEANIRNNECFKPDDSYSITAGGRRSLLCDMDQRTGENISIKVSDKETAEALEDVSVYFNAGDSCHIGETDANGELKAQLPDAYGWILNLKKEGYADFYVHEQEFSSNLKMTPLKELNISFAVINESSYDELADMTRTQRLNNKDEYLINLTENHTLTLQLKRIKENYNDPEIEEVISFMNGTAIPSTVSLVPGKYTIDAQLFLAGNFTIPEERDRLCVEKEIWYERGEKCERREYPLPRACLDGYDNVIPDCLITAYCYEKKGGCEKDEEVIYPKMNLTMTINGGAFRNESRPWEVDDDLYDSESVTFYLYSQNIPTRQSHLEEMEKYKEWKKDLIEPKLR